MARFACFRFLAPALLLAPGTAHAQVATPIAANVQPTAANIQQREQVQQQLQELLRSRQNLLTMQQNMQKQMSDFDARIAALEAELGVTPPKNEVVQLAPPPAAKKNSRASASQDKDSDASASQDKDSDASASQNKDSDASASQTKDSKGWPFVPGTGLVLAEGKNAGLALGVNGYVRYLNQGGLKPTYTDSFNRTFQVQKRQDVQLNRLQLQFRGWMFDERFRWTFYVWTQNPSQGDPAQVVVGGNVNYTFADWLRVWAGIFSIPSTRTTAQSFPNWLMIDHRGMADEFFRGSYSQGFQATGKLPFRLFYNVSVTDNLSILGVSASQLAFGLDTYSASLYWMPTTGEYGPGFGFGDYEDHKHVATLLGVHFTKSREDSQEQPATNAIENSQIRLSDGTVIFSPNAFNTGGQITKATYEMLDLDSGVKYRGWSLDGEYYIRWVNDFDVHGFIPVTHLYDTGFQALASGMVIPRFLQAYVEGSKIYGQYGAPWDATVGLTYFPFAHKQVRVNIEGIYMYRSPIGYTAVPYTVGGTGWVWTFNVGTWF